MFCGGTPLTREDIVPQWLRVLYRDQLRPLGTGPVGNNVRSLRQTPQTPAEILSQWPSKAPEVVAKVVCSTCNNGWMSAIESAAVKALLPLIKGRPRILGRAEKQTIADWLGLKALLQLHSESVEPFPPAWAAAYFRKQATPLTWHVRIGRTDPSVGVILGGTTFTYASRPYLAAVPYRRRGFACSFAFGALCAQVVALEEFVKLPVDGRLLLPIWPPPERLDVPAGLPLVLGVWPPLTGNSGDQVHAMGHSPLPADEPRGS